jgi:hypothetical protein
MNTGRAVFPLRATTVGAGSSGSQAAVLRRSEPTRLSSANDDKVGGLLARSAASGASKSNTAMREQLKKGGCPG